MCLLRPASLSHNHLSAHLFTSSPSAWHGCKHPENAWHGVWPVSTTYLRLGMAELKGKCGAGATQQPCLNSTKWLQTWRLIHSVMRSPQSDSPAAVCQDCPRATQVQGTMEKEVFEQKQSYCFNKKLHFLCRSSCVLNQFCSCFSSFLWEILLWWVLVGKSVFPLFLCVNVHINTGHVRVNINTLGF